MSDAAVTLAHQHKLNHIPGSCPMMFCEPVDLSRNCMRWVSTLSEDLPKTV